MSKVHAFLLVPVEGDPHGLLAEGACGARPPLAWMNGPRWVFGWASAQAHVRALVLAVDGKPVAEGMDRASRVDPHYRSEAWASARALGREMERLGYGTLVLLDAEGREREVSDE